MPQLASVFLHDLDAWHRELARWLQPGGHLEPGDESAFAAALREAGEETETVNRQSSIP